MVAMTANLTVGQILVQGYDGDTIYEGHPFYVSAEYQNHSEHATGPFHLQFTLDGGHAHHLVEVHDLGPGEAAWAQWEVANGVATGSHHLHVDFTGIHHESPHVHEAGEQHFQVHQTHAVAENETRDEAELARAYLSIQHDILTQWNLGLQDFQTTMTSETSDSAKPDVAHAMLEFVEEKVLGTALGHIPEVMHAEFAVGAFKAYLAEYERAKKAAVSVQLRDFISANLHSISEMLKNLTAMADWPAEVPTVLNRLLANGQADAYAAIRGAIAHLHDDAQQRAASLDLDTFFKSLAAQWISDVVHGTIAIQIRHHDLSVIHFEVQGADGDKLTEHLASMRGGVDLWALKVPRRINVYDNDNGWWEAVLELDASNRLVNSPAEDFGDWRKVYERLHAQGHLIATHH